jgi:LysM repeat protein
MAFINQRKNWAIGGLLLLLLATGCASAQNADNTPTPLNPALFPPPGTTGPNAHTPVITPLSDGAAGPVTLPAGSATAKPLTTTTSQSGAQVLVSPTPGSVTTPAIACTPPAGWVSYTVQAGDTLSTLAATYAIPVAQLIAANCLTNADVITVGQTIYVPAKANPTP